MNREAAVEMLEFSRLTEVAEFFLLAFYFHMDNNLE